MNTWISVEDALEVILDSVVPLLHEKVSITNALSRILASPVESPIDLPPFDNSAMDGFTFANPKDWTLPMKCVGTSAAGSPYMGSIKKGEAIRIMTGAVVPDGCDTIMPVENTSYEDENNEVSLSEEPVLGAHIRKKASYLKRENVSITAGTSIDPGIISMLASFGVSEVDAVIKPRVSIITTGDELVPVDVVPRPGQIRNSNAHMLEALIQSVGATAIRYEITRDDPAAIKARFEEAVKDSDVVLSVGGVSMGDFDFVRDTILELTNSPAFWKVKVKPGKPLTYGRIENTHLLGLPGNPMSSFVSFHLFAKPLISRLLGKNETKQYTMARCGEDYKSTPKRREYMSGRLEYTDGGPVFYRIGTSSSGDPTGMAGCKVFGISPIGEALVGAGSSIKIEML